MSEYTHETAPTQFLEAGGIRFAYRRFGRAGGIPLVFFNHFRGNLETFDPAITNGFAADREVILFDNAGVGASTGTPRDTVPGIAASISEVSMAPPWMPCFFSSPENTFSG